MSRTKSPQAHNKVLEAALELFAERGIEGTSVDAIAAASGVSKATIYKHWHDKDSLALEALGNLLGLNEKPPVFDSGDLRRDLIDALNYQPPEPDPEKKNRIMPHLMAYGARNREFGSQWRGRAIERPRRQITDILKRAVAKGKLPKTIDYEVSIAMLLGPMLYQHIFLKNSLASVKLPPDLAATVVSGFWKANCLRR
ncbi:MAG TPA: TetR/AcrR family transcriptional regulator [Terriglobales bacterium]|jgi:AcrR family transcriptional regulator|nr:TetR/AcrR family transcriptional regulator [Terriglobales bacterium]